MYRIFLLLLSLILFVVTGCSTNSKPEYSGTNYRQIKHYEIGEIVAVRNVRISDDGTGTFVGALVGTVLGSLTGGGRGNALATLIGGLGGAYVGGKANKANAQELSVKLDNGEDIVVIAKGQSFLVGDKVKIIKEGNRVEQVYRIR
jgi:outer membrane lipoprotein SlyB